MATYICTGRESFTFNPHILRGLVGKATDAAVCFPWLHFNSPDQTSYPSIFLERTQVKGRQACRVLRYADSQLAAAHYRTAVSLKPIARISLIPEALAVAAGWFVSTGGKNEPSF